MLSAISTARSGRTREGWTRVLEDMTRYGLKVDPGGARRASWTIFHTAMAP